MADTAKKSGEKSLYEEKIFIERVGEDEPESGPFLVEAQISEEVRAKLNDIFNKWGVDITETTVTGLLEDGSIMVNMHLISEDFDELVDPFFYIELVEKSMSDKEVAKTLFKGVQNIRAKVRMVRGGSDKLVARATLVLKKKVNTSDISLNLV